MCLGLEVTASPQKSVQPDVLQLNSPPEDRNDEQKPFLFAADSAAGGPSVLSSSHLELDDGLVYSREASEQAPDHPIGQVSDLSADSFIPDAENHKLEPSTAPNMDVDANRSITDSAPIIDGAQACALFENLLGLDGEKSHDKEVSRLFAELDELSLAASQVQIPEEFVRCWAAEMVMALSSLHQEGIICKDLNPNNILLDHQGQTHLESI